MGVADVGVHDLLEGVFDPRGGRAVPLPRKLVSDPVRLHGDLAPDGFYSERGTGTRKKLIHSYTYIKAGPLRDMGPFDRGNGRRRANAMGGGILLPYSIDLSLSEMVSMVRRLRLGVIITCVDVSARWGEGEGRGEKIYKTIIKPRTDGGKPIEVSKRMRECRERRERGKKGPLLTGDHTIVVGSRRERSQRHRRKHDDDDECEFLPPQSRPTRRPPRSTG